MGSTAMDHSGNLANGFSASSSTIFPQLRYATRLSTSLLNTLDGEAHLFDGLGSQTGTSNRWGDYSALTVDPVDDTTMWFTSEYYPAGVTSFNWRTRVGNFRIDPNQPLLNVSAKSSLTHGAAGPFDIDLPLYAGAAGPGRGIESRLGSGGTAVTCKAPGDAGSYTIVFNFTNPITGVGGVTSSCGTATAAIGADNHQVLTSLAAGACNGQYITVQLNNVTDGTNTISPSVTFGLLIGDATANGAVDSSDIAEAKSRSGATCPPTLRADANGDGVIDSSDISVVKSNSGCSLPTSP
jgi:hypothetical protein